MKYRTSRLRFLLLFAIYVAGSGFVDTTIAGPQSALPAESSEITTKRYAAILARNARLLVQINPLTTEAIETASDLAMLAGELSPNDAGIWRLILGLAELGENAERTALALARLSEIDPQNQVVRLKRLIAATGAYQTVEEREEAIRMLLESDELDPAVGSQLALELALLNRRQGLNSAFTNALAQAVALDSSNRAAAALAAGYFQANVDDPFAEAELLTNLMLADPTDLGVTGSLAELLLNHGAYRGAARLYELVARGRSVDGGPASNNLVADWAIALWGAGRSETALRLIQERQQLINEYQRYVERKDDPELLPTDVAEVEGNVGLTLSAVRAAMLDLHGTDEELERALLHIERAYEEAKSLVAERTGDSDEMKTEGDKRIREYALQTAWLLIWLSDDADRATSYMDEASAIAPLDGGMGDRINGWAAMRRGEFDVARRLLSPLAESDPASRLGLAVTEIEAGDRREAARHLLLLMRHSPGTLMAMWAGDRVKQVLPQLADRDIPISDTATKMEELVRSLPSYISRFPDDPSLAFSVRVSPTKSTFDPFDPLTLNIEISNNTSFPLAIDRHGPIRPQLVIYPTVRVASAGNLPELSPIIVDIDQRLRIEPRTRFTTTFDLRETRVGSTMQRFLLEGAIVRLRVLWNYFSPGDERLTAGFLGGESDLTPFRIDGVRVSDAWIDQALIDLETIDAIDEVERMVMLCHLLVRYEREAASGFEQPGSSERSAEIARIVNAAYPQLDTVERAWFLSMMQKSAAVQPIIDAAAADENQLVRIAYLFSHISAQNDPMLDAAARSDDALVQRVGQQVVRMLEMVQQARRRAMEEARKRREQEDAATSGRR